MNVLSLFDGMSCGQIALERAGLAVDTYYASEIDQPAINVCLDNYPNTVQLGDVTKIDTLDLPPNIDLLLAGSPCQGFSFMGKQLAFDDPRSSLYFEFLRIKNEIGPEYFLLENVHMKQEFQDVITDHLGVAPIAINSAVLCAASRPRLYWTNIPDISSPEPVCAKPYDIIDWGDLTPNSDSWHTWWELKHEYQLSKRYSCFLNDAPKAVCQTARQFANWSGNLVRLMDGVHRFANRIECERLQTLPENYTRAASKTQAYKMIGNGWTVDVIAHILKHINQ